MEKSQKKIVLGLGSNCGDRHLYLRQAILALKALHSIGEARVLALSPVYDSAAMLPPGAPPSWDMPYSNVNVLIETPLSPQSLLEKVKAIEVSVGRVSRGRWGPREVDIDLLMMESGSVDSETLKVPHAGLLERPFALLPLADLVPHWELSGVPVSEYARRWTLLPGEEIPFCTRRSGLIFPELVGVLNLTSDSFSDGGAYLNLNHAEAQIEKLARSGISVLDLGAESTRPGARPVSPDLEWERVSPVLTLLKEKKFDRRILISVDTRHPETMLRSLEMGIDWINDVSGLTDPRVLRSVADSGVSVVLMHSLGIPPSQARVLPQEEDPVDHLLRWAEDRIEGLEKLGISRNRTIFDPGIGFGKTPAQTWQILRHAQRFHDLGVSVLIGHSRKSFLQSVSQVPASDRDIETAAISIDLAEKGIEYLRIHNAEMHQRGLKAWAQANGVSQFTLPRGKL